MAHRGGAGNFTARKSAAGSPDAARRHLESTCRGFEGLRPALQPASTPPRPKAPMRGVFQTGPLSAVACARAGGHSCRRWARPLTTAWRRSPAPHCAARCSAPIRPAIQKHMEISSLAAPLVFCHVPCPSPPLRPAHRRSSHMPRRMRSQPAGAPRGSWGVTRGAVTMPGAHLDMPRSLFEELWG